MFPTEGRSRLFHAIVAVGAALGSACGGATVPEHEGESLDASSNQDPKRDSGAAGAEASLVLPASAVAPDAAPDAGAGGDGAIAVDAGVCAQPFSNGKACAPSLDAGPIFPGCCQSGVCFPCYV